MVWTFKNEITGVIRVAKMTTNAIRILPLRNVMSGLQTLVKDLGTRFQITKKILENSDMTYIYANRIKICVVANDGKRVRRTGGRQLIQKFKWYPWGCRGMRRVINVNADRRLENDRREVVAGSLSPCVKYALKAHFINISDTLPNRDEIIEGLTGNQSPLRYTRVIREALLKQHIVVPDTLRDKGITIRDIKKLEKANEVPIVVYYLDYTATRKQRKTREQAMKTIIESGGDPYDADHYMHDVSLTCIRAPTQKILTNYTKPPCHLLMIGPKHVCYIPNIQEYMLQVFDTRFRDLASIKDANMRRYPLCFGLLRDQPNLLTHLKSGNCYKNQS